MVADEKHLASAHTFNARPMRCPRRRTATFHANAQNSSGSGKHKWQIAIHKNYNLFKIKWHTHACFNANSKSTFNKRHVAMPLEHFQYKWLDLSICIAHWSHPNGGMAGIVGSIWIHFRSKRNSHSVSGADRIDGFPVDTLGCCLVAPIDPKKLAKY